MNLPYTEDRVTNELDYPLNVYLLRASEGFGFREFMDLPYTDRFSITNEWDYPLSTYQISNAFLTVFTFSISRLEMILRAITGSFTFSRPSPPIFLSSAVSPTFWGAKKLFDYSVGERGWGKR